ncbi:MULTISPECIES: Zn-dependent hydrolase [Ureibacillus]|jgi:N-carbamoyl-L-amino-acid hydrolase|uniref:N-carbamoyl-L-amino-acid hydrolase n=1 Tax=Ureibacillus thermosphaericus TaxID=51173 RepID=A0A840PPN4_URETH|nr:Zn-dependent hydrolase [Ureibacillus thermosphaericus]MBB5147993.1 N-carbamoyl-L-amino-acid hydrolase [Ureibacillus thermosphaericus]NKZ30706.1 Zn-dependent hydrolase [Ureibacillus thermosphaericus]
MKVCNANRLRETIEAFAEIGKTKNNGVTRLSLSKEDIEARKYFIKCCEELGMSIKIDDMANIYATLPGKKDLPPILMGSHLDSVEKGGRFDGVLGVVTPLEVVRTLKDLNIELEFPITLVNFTNEEGARFDPAMMSSGVLTGKFDKEKMLKSTDKNGITFGEALENSGFKGDEQNRLKEGTAFIELHIEQGPVLESEQKEIGVVEGVVGMVCYEITVKGESNHAGTFPMKHRKDALFLAADLITHLKQELGKLDEELVYTMGRVNVHPNIHTVVPNLVKFTLESRHKDPNVIKQVETIIHSLPTESNGCTVSFEKLWGRDTVPFDETIVNTIESVSKSLGYSTRRMYSGAGHDAQFIASIVPTAMIFVPSVGGRSHCEEELTYYEDCYKGANVLLQTLLSLHDHYLSKYSSASKNQ